MKKLVVMLIGIVTVAIIIGGCGVGDTDEDDFFEKYYAECIQLCETCALWTELCGYSNYDINICVEKQWQRFVPQNYCISEVTRIIHFMNIKDCTIEELEGKCLTFQ